MRIATKAQIAKATLILLTATTWLFLLGVLVLVLCVGFGINPFRRTTTDVLFAAFSGLIGIAAILVLLNVATNISLIADAKLAGADIDEKSGGLRRWAVAFAIAALAVVALVFGGTYASKERYIRVVRAQADEVLGNNQALLEEISQRLASGKLQDVKRVNEIRTFLERQRSGLPDMTILYSGKFADKVALYQVDEYIHTKDEEKFEPSYYACDENVDCTYLHRFFSGEDVAPLQNYEVRGDEFYIYVPVKTNSSRIVLLFERRNAYGKIGS